MLTLASDQHRGSNISWESRFKKLDEELTEISKVSGLGWDVILDIQQKNGYSMYLKGGISRSISQRIRLLFLVRNLRVRNNFLSLNPTTTTKISVTSLGKVRVLIVMLSQLEKQKVFPELKHSLMLEIYRSKTKISKHSQNQRSSQSCNREDSKSFRSLPKNFS
jgi:hypothetical protein